MSNITYHPKAIIKKSESLTTWENHLRSKENDIKHRELDLIEVGRELRYKEVQIDSERKKHLFQVWVTFFIGLTSGLLLSNLI